MIHCVSHSTCHWPAHKWMGDIVQYCPYLGEQPPLHLYRVRAHPHNIIGLASVYGVCQHLRHSACCPSMKVWVWHWPQQKILIVVWQMLTDLSRVRKYRRLKPFLFITVVIMVNVYSTLNFRGPPTPPPFFFSREWSTSLLLWPGWGSTCTTGPDSNGLLLFYPIKLRSQFVRFIVWKFSLCPKCIFLNLLSS